jgi:hypothetical protein
MNDRAKYLKEVEYWQNEHTKYWPISAELMAEYKNGTQTSENMHGTLSWEQNGELHRDGDKPAVISAYSVEWWYNGELHRDGDKPAVAVIGADGTLQWWQNDQRHRFRGPAIIHANGKLEWWIWDEQVPVSSQEEFIRYLETKTLQLTQALAYAKLQNQSGDMP